MVKIKEFYFLILIFSSVFSPLGHITHILLNNSKNEKKNQLKLIKLNHKYKQKNKTKMSL